LRLIQDPYLKQSVIQYLGNKRNLLAFISSNIDSILDKDSALNGKVEPLVFVDAFSGSGIVGRLGRLKGFEVISNDLEDYARVIAIAHSTTPKNAEHSMEKVWWKLKSSNDLTSIWNGSAYQTVIDYLNELKEPVLAENKFFSKWYAPKKTHDYCVNSERLFYSQENALKIDAIIEKINEDNLFCDTTKNLILADLCHKMTAHNNSSGQMRCFFKDWKRPTSMKELNLEVMELISGAEGSVAQCRAETLFVEHNIKADITYLDPPYTDNHYSSNYHMLNSAVLNDKQDIGEVKKHRRSGIRHGFNKSGFSNESTALASFTELLENINTKYLLVSYSNDGFMSKEEIKALLGKFGEVSTRGKLHSSFGGGLSNKNKSVVEYIFTVKMNNKMSIIEKITKLI
jgi:adenine-specific DNA-methyltransferase